MFIEWLIATVSVLLLLAMAGFILWEVDRANRERGEGRHAKRDDAALHSDDHERPLAA